MHIIILAIHKSQNVATSLILFFAVLLPQSPELPLDPRFVNCLSHVDVGQRGYGHTISKRTRIPSVGELKWEDKALVPAPEGQLYI